MSQKNRANLRPETLLKDYNAMYFLNIEDEKDLPVTEKNTQEEQVLDWEVTNIEKFENYVEFDKTAHLESKYSKTINTQLLELKFCSRLNQFEPFYSHILIWWFILDFSTKL